MKKKKKLGLGGKKCQVVPLRVTFTLVFFFLGNNTSPVSAKKTVENIAKD